MIMKQTEKEYCMENCMPVQHPKKNISINQLNKHIGNNKNIKLTEVERDIIIASSYNHKTISDIHTVYLFEGINKLDYLFWKSDMLNRLCPKFKQLHRYNKSIGRTTTNNILYFSSNEKIEQILNDDHDISLRCLAFIIMDNATFEHNAVILNIKTNKIKHFIEAIKIHNIDCNLDIHSNIITFNSFNFINLKNAIYKYMYDGLKYKIGQEYNNLPICTVSKTVVFDSAHFLDEYDGKCNNLHGGRYELTVYIKDSINPDTGMVVDFTYLKKVLKEKITDKFDHHCLNYTVPQLAWRSTTELICVYIWQQLIKPFPSLYKIELKETPNSKCEYYGQSGATLQHLSLLN